MAIIRTPKELVDQYEASTAINQSGLKVIGSKGIQFFLDNQQSILKDGDKYEKEKEHFLLGKALDTRICFTKPIYDSLYFTSKLANKPGPTVVTILKRAHDWLASTDADIYEIGTYHQLIHAACDEAEYYMNRRKEDPRGDTRVTGIINDSVSAEYWRDLSKARGKVVLSDLQSETVEAMYKSLTEHQHTKHLFEDREHVITLYQKPLYFRVEDVDCKALPDKIDIDTRSRVINIQDIKTIGDYVLQFVNSIRSRRYDIQGAFYTEAVKHNIPELSQATGIDLSGYTINNFSFIVESTKFPGIPMHFPISTSLIEQGETGYAEKNIMGYKELLDIYKFWLSMDFNIERGVSKAQGCLWVNANYKFENLYY